MINIFLDATESIPQNPVSQSTTIFLIISLVFGIGMIGFGVYMTMKNKKRTGFEPDDTYNEPRYKSETENIGDDEDFLEGYPREEIFVPSEVEKFIKPNNFVNNEISHSVKTSAYKVRDSIRCAHDIPDDVLNKNGYLAILCDGIKGDEDTPAYISKRIMDEFYSSDRKQTSVQDFFENVIDKLDSELVKFSNDGKAGTSMLACVLMDKELYIIGIGGARLYHLRGEHLKQLTSEHRYSLELDAKVRSGEMDLIEAQNNPRRDDLISYIGVGGINYIDMNDVPIMLNEGDILLYCSDGLYSVLDDDEIFNAVRKYDGVFKNCAKVLTEAAMSSANAIKDNDISVLMIKIGK